MGRTLGLRVRQLNQKVGVRCIPGTRPSTDTLKLLNIRLGPGAVKLPKDVSRLHLRFAPKMYKGHHGPLKFWREELVRLKYHNPAVSMTIDRNVTNEEDPLMTIFFTPKDARMTSGSDTAAPAPTTSTSGDKVASEYTPTERTETIKMTWKAPQEILNELIQITKPTPVQPTAEEKALLDELAAETARAEADSKRCLAVIAEKKRQEEILAEARGQMS